MCNITLRVSTESDGDFVNDLTRRTMRDCVESTWSNVEDRERYYAINQFSQPTTRIIQCDGEDIGRITVTCSNGHVILEGIHIVEGFQGKGIGGRLIKKIVREANERKNTLELVLLKTNPARQLYERVGFYVYREDNDRYYMKIPASE